MVPKVTRHTRLLTQNTKRHPMVNLIKILLLAGRDSHAARSRDVAALRHCHVISQVIILDARARVK